MGVTNYYWLELNYQVLLQWPFGFAEDKLGARVKKEDLSGTTLLTTTLYVNGLYEVQVVPGQFDEYTKYYLAGAQMVATRYYNVYYGCNTPYTCTPTTWGAVAPPPTTPARA
jgi:hypothetical protein